MLPGFWHAIEPYQHLDPQGWLRIAGLLSPLVGVLLGVLGILLLSVGGGSVFRIVALPLGGLVAMLWLSPIVQKFGVNASTAEIVATTGAVTLGVLGVFFPPAVVFFAFGMPCGLVAGQLAGTADWLLGFVPGFVVGGAMGIVLGHVFRVVLACLVGAWSLVIGTSAALGPSVAAVKTMAASPVLMLAVAFILWALGIAYQLFVKPTPEEKGKKDRERKLNERQDAEAKARDARWARIRR